MFYEAPENLVKNGVLDEKAAAIFADTKVNPQKCSLFTNIKDTTTTINAKISNFKCHERDLTAAVEPNKYVLTVDSNYGSKRYPNYQLPEKKQKSNRGRKPKPPPLKKKNKKGKEFNSQVTFKVTGRDYGGDIVPATAKIFIFKVFRNGSVQIPGLVNQEDIYEAVDCFNILVKHFAVILNPAKPFAITSIVPNMRNFKFACKIPSFQNIDQMRLKQIIKDSYMTYAPRICDIDYEIGKPCIAIRFITPFKRKPTKKIRVQIYRSGKINILGGITPDSTQDVVDRLAEIFEKYRDEIIICNGSYKPNFSNPEYKKYYIAQKTKEYNELFAKFSSAELAEFEQMFSSAISDIVQATRNLY